MKAIRPSKYNLVLSRGVLYVQQSEKREKRKEEEKDERKRLIMREKYGSIIDNHKPHNNTQYLKPSILCPFVKKLEDYRPPL